MSKKHEPRLQKKRKNGRVGLFFSFEGKKKEQFFRFSLAS